MADRVAYHPDHVVPVTGPVSPPPHFQTRDATEVLWDGGFGVAGLPFRGAIPYPGLMDFFHFRLGRLLFGLSGGTGGTFVELLGLGMGRGGGGTDRAPQPFRQRRGCGDVGRG